MSDYTIHQDDLRKRRFLVRFDKLIKKAEDNPQSAMTLSTMLLWNKKSLQSSFKDYLRKYKLKGDITIEMRGGATPEERGLAAEMREMYPAERLQQIPYIDRLGRSTHINQLLNSVVHERNSYPIHTAKNESTGVIYSHYFNHEDLVNLRRYLHENVPKNQPPFWNG
jgi:hypothetical protein